jgi:hypothetical protein
LYAQPLRMLERAHARLLRQAPITTRTKTGLSRVARDSVA